MKEGSVLNVLMEFLSESRENLSRAERELIQLEEKPGSEDLVNSVFRVFHSLKGSSGFLGLTAIAQTTHKLENILTAVKERQRGVDKEMITLVLRGVDIISGAINRAEEDPAATGLTEEERTFIKELEDYVQASGPKALLSHGEGLIEKLVQVVREMKDVDMEVSAHPLIRKIAGEMDALMEEISGRKRSRDVRFNCIWKEKDFNGQARILFAGMDKLRQGVVTDALLDEMESALSLLSAPFEGEKRALYEKTMFSFQNIKKGWKMVDDQMYREFFADFYKDYMESIKSIFSPAPSSKREEAPPPVSRQADPSAGKGEDKGGHQEDKFIRIRQEKLDQFMDQLGELIITKDVFNSVYYKFQEGKNGRSAGEELLSAVRQMDEITGGMQSSLMEIRKIPLKQIFQKLPRLVREVSATAGKKVGLSLIGEEILLDKNLVELLEDPLVHLLRNSIDHGIEASSGERTLAGKPEEGKVTVSANAGKEWAYVEIKDDGRGIDVGKIKKIAVRRGLLTEMEANSLVDREAYKLILQPGFSTAEKITDISGRGVGMDVVMSNLKKCGGQLDIDTVPGKGSRFILSLPQALTLVTADAIMVKLGGEIFALPAENMESVVDIKERDIQFKDYDGFFRFNGGAVRVMHLSRLLSVSPLKSAPDVNSHHAGDLTAVVMKLSDGERVGLIVDDIENYQKIVVRSFKGPYLKSLERAGFSGFTLLGDGRVVLILDMETLAQEKVKAHEPRIDTNCF